MYFSATLSVHPPQLPPTVSDLFWIRMSTGRWAHTGFTLTTITTPVMPLLVSCMKLPLVPTTASFLCFPLFVNPEPLFPSKGDWDLHRCDRTPLQGASGALHSNCVIVAMFRAMWTFSGTLIVCWELTSFLQWMQQREVFFFLCFNVRF